MVFFVVFADEPADRPADPSVVTWTANISASGRTQVHGTNAARLTGRRMTCDIMCAIEHSGDKI